MRIELTEVLWLHEHQELSMTQLAELSGLSEAEIHELVDYGAIAPINSDAAPRTFAARCIVAARAARRLRDDFELNIQGVALALTFLDRVHELEAQLRDLRARLPHQNPLPRHDQV
jgi:chaperone modulatory protein CbpM